MLTDFLEELKGNMTMKEKATFLELVEKYPKIKRRIIKELKQKEKEYYKRNRK